MSLHIPRLLRWSLAGMAVLAGTALSQPAFRSPLSLPSAPSALAGRAPVNALAMAGTRLVSAGQRGHILFSDDEGKTWTQAAVPVSSDLTAVYFVDARQGWAAGHEGVILHSADGGATWQLQLDGQRAAQLVVHQYGQPSQPADASAERLARDAATFAAQGADKPFLDIYFENEREGFAIGAFNLILRTEDGGQIWTPWLDRVDNPDALHLYAMRPAAGTLFMVGEQGLTLKLDRERGRFVRVPLPYKGTLFGVLGTPQMVMVFGLRGNAWRSTDGGASWTRTNTGVNAGLAGGMARSDGSILLASQAGQLLRSTDDGASFDRVALGRVAPVFALAASTTQAVALGGPDGVRMEWLKTRRQVVLSDNNIQAMPVIRDLRDFDSRSGSLFERLIFNHRLMVVALCVLATVLLGWQATRLTLNAAFEKTIPHHQPYIRNFLDNRAELKGLGNAVRVVVENKRGDIFEPAYLQALKQINDELFLTPGVDRANVKSLWMPVVRWNEVTEEGFTGAPVMPDRYDGSPASTEQLRQNIARAQILGSLVGTDWRSSMIFVPLLDKDPRTGAPLDYHALSQRLEDIRSRFAQAGGADVDIRIVGFAKVVGDLLDGLTQVMGYFAVAAAIAAAILYGWTRCVRSTALVLGCSLVAVLWQLGLVTLLGYELDPYSILVPFLVFAIGVSHGAQKMNGIMQDVARGTHRLVAARYTFRRLFLAGLTALVADAVGFAVLMLIDIPVIQDLAITASLGVALLVVTNLVLLPVMLSYTGVSPKAAARSLRAEQRETGGMWRWLERFAQRRWASAALAVAAVLAVAGFAVSTHLRVGDLDPGASELRPHSRYNLDNAYINGKYSLSSDQFAVIVKTPPEGCLTYQTLMEADRLGWALQQVPGVQSTVSLADAVRKITAGSYEGNPKWLSISPNQDVLNYAARTAITSNPELFNTECSVMPVIAYLADHKADTLERMVKAAGTFAEAHSTPEHRFLLAAGSAGIEAATNIVVKQANVSMLVYVYAAVIVLCFITFRSWRAVVVAVLPLVVTSILCEALMVMLGMGVKVATLPVIALGVGIGVDYALYLLSIQLARQRAGCTLAEAYRDALRFTGKVVALVGVTLAAGVVTWAWSPIKFQADMGILLTFMFLWNMLGALVLIPALSHFLLRDVSASRAPSHPETLAAPFLEIP